MAATSQRLPPTRLALVALTTALLLPLAACGSGDPEPTRTNQASSADTSCRDRWADLGEDLSGREDATAPSALAPRWTNLIATVRSYAASAKASDCSEALEALETQITATEQLSVSLERFDLEHQLAEVEPAATTYTTLAKPPKGKPGPNVVAQALRALTTAAPQANEQMRPGWQEANTVDPADAAAVKSLLGDLKFLAGDSPAYATGTQALTVIRKVV